MNYFSYITTKQNYLKLKISGNHFGGIYNEHKNIPKNNTVEFHLKKINEMNFEGVNKGNWDLVGSIMDKNVMCRFSNGVVLYGIEQTIDMMMRQVLVWAPDTKIKEHLIMFGSGNWTCTNFIIEGTFTKPIDLMNGDTLKPNNNKFIMNKCMINRWFNDLITEFHIFGDSLEMKRQLNIP